MTSRTTASRKGEPDGVSNVAGASDAADAANLADFDEFDDLAEIEALEAFDRDRPTEHQLAGGAPRSYGILVAVLAAIGIVASTELVLSEMAVLADPDAQLSCNINPLIGCGNFLQTGQGHVLFGIPNGLFGMLAYAALAAVGVVLAAGARLPRWFWLFLLAGVWGSALFVLWFMSVSFFVVHALCPFCLIIWLVTIPLVTQTTARAVQGGHLRVGERLGGVLVRERWVLTVVLYVLLAGAILVAYWESWAMLVAGTLR